MTKAMSDGINIENPMIESSRHLIRAACVAAILGYSPTAAMAGSTGVTAIRAADFLSSLGVNTKIQQGQDPVMIAPLLTYLGVRNIRDSRMQNMTPYITLHQATGVLVDVEVGSGPTKDAAVPNTVLEAKQLVASGALLSIEGPNEPNNFGVTYQGMTCCKNNASWLPVAKLQRDLYTAVKADPILKRYPVFHVSEVGAESDNQGLQWNTIPAGEGTLMPAGTKYADYANDHNYVEYGIYNDNKAWGASQPFFVVPFDGEYPEHGNTWAKGFIGYSSTQLPHLPRVTTETGWSSGDDSPANNEIKARVLLNVFLDQYAAGWRYTFVYELTDFGQPGWGYYKDYVTPRPAATYLHNLTTILADTPSWFAPRQLNYSIPNEPATVHNMLMQKSNGKFYLAVWGEQVSGSNIVTVNLGGIYSVVRAFDPTISGTVPSEPPWTKVSQVSVSASDHPLILEITP